MQQNLQNKAGLVDGVFNKVYDKYDLMNDFMSFGIHRLWKKNLMNWMNPTKNKKYLDVACGTGDLGKLFLDYTDKNGEIISSDSNSKMIEKGKKRLSKYKNIKWVVAEAEKLPFKNDTFDFYTISFGLRNTKNLDKSLSEAYRVLKPGGKYCCLEFSTPKSSLVSNSYKIYKSKILPLLGEIIAKDKRAYTYLSESIDLFPSQEELSKCLINCGFEKIETINLFNGIVAIHIGYKSL